MDPVYSINEQRSTHVVPLAATKNKALEAGREQSSLRDSYPGVAEIYMAPVLRPWERTASTCKVRCGERYLGILEDPYHLHLMGIWIGCLFTTPERHVWCAIRLAARIRIRRTLWSHCRVR